MPGTKISTLKLLMVTSALGVASAQTEYFPLDEGNTWVYRGSAAGQYSTLTLKVNGKATADGREYSVVDGWPGFKSVWMRRDNAKVMAYDPETKQESVWWDFGAASGTRWLTSVDQCSTTAVMDSKEFEYRGPIGQFRSGLRIEYPPSGCADAGVNDDVFLPSVGLVRRSYSTIAGPRTYHLIYARLGTSTVIEEASLGFSVSVDQAAPVITARLALKNTTGTPVTLTFSSGQTYDIVLRDKDNNDVYRWSADRSFIEMVREVSFQNETVWTEPINVKALPPGRYTLEAWLTTLGDPKYKGSVAFEIPRQ